MRSTSIAQPNYTVELSRNDLACCNPKQPGVRSPHSRTPMSAPTTDGIRRRGWNDLSKEVIPMPTIPQSVVDKDHELDTRSERAGEALAKHRWQQTLDPKGPQYGFRAYADAVGRSEKAIRYHANGYALVLERASDAEPGSSPINVQDAIRLAAVKEEDRAMHEAIAKGSGRTIAQVSRGDNRHRTRAVVERAKQRAERRGGDPVDHARDIADEERRVAAARKTREKEERERRSLRYVHIEGHLAGAQRRLLSALSEAEGVGFNDDEMELIRDSLAKVRAVLDLIDLRMAGTPDIDWDAEAARLMGDPA
jgi:hypothetical protein